VNQVCPSLIMQRLQVDGVRSLLSNSNPIIGKVQTIYEIVSAASDMHKAGIFHGDLKRENILTEQNKIRIIDFNISLPLDPESIAAWHSDKYHVSRNLLMDLKLYPASWLTPPDILSGGEPQLKTKIDFEQVEWYVTGCLIFHLLEQNLGKLPWVGAIRNKHIESIRGRPNLDQAERTSIVKQHAELIERGLERINRDPNYLSQQVPEEERVLRRIRYMLLNLMRHNPLERWPLEQAMEYMRKEVGQYLLAG
jgi:serine/threonine protein kinase